MSTSSKLTSPPIDHRIFVVIIVLVMFGLALVGFIVYITVRLKKRGPYEASGPYEGTLVHPDHPAAQITPFGGGGPHLGRNTPRFSKLTLIL